MTLRKTFWCCAALSVAAATGVYLAADHASRHHDSCMGRLAVAAYQAAVHYNPVYLFGQAASGNTAVAVANSTPCCKSSATPCAAVCIQVEADEPAINPSACRLPGSIGLREEESEPRLLDGDWGPGGVAVELIPPPTAVGECLTPKGGVEESEQLPIVPRVVEEEAPAFMPYADEPETPGGFLGFWKQFFRKMSSGGVGFKDCCQEKEEESEAPNYGTPPECREDPHHSQQYPGCPASICPHHRNYCPYSGRAIVPAVEPEPRPEMDPISPAPAQSPKSVQASRSRFLDEAEECEARPKHPEVDTMEFRSTDAKPGEFRLVPI